MSITKHTMSTDFNPRSHEGSDAFVVPQDAQSIISILAPTRGATILTLTTLIMRIFQSSLPRGERPGSGIHAITSNDFNPRSHEGSDRNFFRNSIAELNFNPRSHEGSDLHQPQLQNQNQNFNPRSHEGSDDSVVSS